MGERTIDARSGIYAFGAITYEMLASGRVCPMDNTQRLGVTHGWLGAFRAEWAKAAR